MMKRRNQRILKAKKNKILSLVHENGPTTINQITKITGISLPETINLVNELMSKDRYLKMEGREKSKGGRPPNIYTINSKIGNIIGVDIGGENYRVILTDFNNRIIQKKSEKISPNGDNLLERISNDINELIFKSYKDKNKILGLGVSVSGYVDVDNRAIIHCPNINLRDFDFYDYFGKRFNLDVFVESSERATAIAEKKFGIARDFRSFLFIALGFGIGMGLFIRNDVYRGATGISGEFGHIIVDKNGPRCTCSNVGCLEAIASGRAIVEIAKKSLLEGADSSLKEIKEMTAKDIAREAYLGDKLSYQLLNTAGINIGKALAIVLNILGPRLVVIGGGLSNSGEILFDAIRRAVREDTLQQIANNVRIEKAALDEFNAALGAAILYANNYFIRSILVEDKIVESRF
ncbi:MAG: ROK family protein [Actinobacteria bacterium]|nr:ROK family protein [Actinomycetota bacterium]